MAGSMSRCQILAVLFAASAVFAQWEWEPSVTPTNTWNQDPASAESTPEPTVNEVDNPLKLWDIAQGFITSVFSDTAAIDNIASLDWPSTVVIGDETYDIGLGSSTTESTQSSESSSSASTSGSSTSNTFSSTLSTSTSSSSSTSSSPTPTSSSASSSVASSSSTSSSTTSSESSSVAAAPTAASEEQQKSPSGPSDRQLGIILGVILGSLAVSIMGIVFWCLRRRRRDTGSFFMGRSDSRSNSPRSWTSLRNHTAYDPLHGPVTYTATAYADPWNKQMVRDSAIPQPRPLAARHPAHQAHPSGSEGQPLVGPSSCSRGDTNPTYHSLNAHEAETAERYSHYSATPPHRRSSSSARAAPDADADDRPPTPFSPMLMMQQAGGGRPSLQQQRYFGNGNGNGNANSNEGRNPFSSLDHVEREARDTVSPIPAVRGGGSGERRYEGMVHYPSMSEVSEFDFAGDGGRGGGVRGMRGGGSGDGGDGWRSGMERTYGKYELA